MAYITKDEIHDMPGNLEKAEYKNIIWKDLSDIIRSAWLPGEPSELKASSLLAAYIDSNFKTDDLKTRAAEVVSKNEHILRILREVEATREQRAFNIACSSPNEAYREKEQIVLMLALNKIVHAKPWGWCTDSKGEALSGHGKMSGIEVRASYYKGGHGYVT
jgi:hypothetical protein